jgi:Polyketide cyclase / dehydrase and lipid transport
MNSTQTRSIAIAAPPEAVVEVLADGTRLPEWAPQFANEARAEGDHWVVDSGGQQLRIRIKASADSGTVDIVSADDERIGSFSRVIPNGEGSEFLFTLLFPQGTDQAAIDAQMAVVEGELETVRSLVERSAAPTSS